MAKWFAVIGSILVGIGVLMGAVAAHLLKGQVSEAAMAIFQTAVLYHLIHALGLVMIGCIGRLQAAGSAWLFWAGGAMLVGLLLFSGSLYVFVVLDVKYITAVAPIGGTMLICSWFALAFALWRAWR